MKPILLVFSLLFSLATYGQVKYVVVINTDNEVKSFLNDSINFKLFHPKLYARMKKIGAVYFPNKVDERPSCNMARIIWTSGMNPENVSSGSGNEDVTSVFADSRHRNVFCVAKQLGIRTAKVGKIGNPYESAESGKRKKRDCIDAEGYIASASYYGGETNLMDFNRPSQDSLNAFSYYQPIHLTRHTVNYFLASCKWIMETYPNDRAVFWIDPKSPHHDNPDYTKYYDNLVMYDRWYRFLFDTITLRSFDAGCRWTAGDISTKHPNFGLSPTFTEYDQTQFYKKVARSIYNLDYELDKVFELVGEDSIAIIYTTDNGQFLMGEELQSVGYAYTWGSGGLWISHPSLNGNIVQSPHFARHADVWPTIFEMLNPLGFSAFNDTTSRKFDGVSLLPYLNTVQPASLYDYAYARNNGDGFLPSWEAVYWKKPPDNEVINVIKYAKKTGQNPYDFVFYEAYNLTTDPCQKTNIYNAGVHAPLLEKMSQLSSCTGTPCSIKN